MVVLMNFYVQPATVECYTLAPRFTNEQPHFATVSHWEAIGSLHLRIGELLMDRFLKVDIRGSYAVHVIRSIE